MMINVKDPGRRKGLRHLAYAIHTRIENEQKIDPLLIPVFGNLWLFNNVAGIEKSEIARDVVVDDDAHPLAQGGQIIHDAQR